MASSDQIAVLLRDKIANTGILTGSAIAFLVALWLVRSQSAVDNVAYMRAMISPIRLPIDPSHGRWCTDRNLDEREPIFAPRGTALAMSGQ